MTGPKASNVRVAHHLPGRTRLTWYPPPLDREGARHLTGRLAAHAGVHRVRTGAGGLLVHHDRSLSATRILELVQEALGVVNDLAGEGRADSAPEPEDQPLGRHFSRVAGVGGILAYLLLRRRIQGPSALASSPVIFNLMAATALAAGYPNLRNGLRYFIGRKSGAHDLLLGLATLTMLYLGEGLLGLTVVWLVNVTDLLQAFLWQKARSVCPLAGPATEPDELTVAARNYAERAALWALAGGILAGGITRDWRRSVTVLLAANPSAAGLVGPAALTGAAFRARQAGVTIGSRRATAALAGVDTLALGGPEDPRDIRRWRADGMRVIRLDEPDEKETPAPDRAVAVLGRTARDVAAMRGAYLALAEYDAPPEVLAAAAVYLPRPGLTPLLVARRLARAAVRRARRGLALVRLANLAGMVLGGTGGLSPAQSTLWAHLTSLGALLTVLPKGLPSVVPPSRTQPDPEKTGILFRPPRQNKGHLGGRWL